MAELYHQKPSTGLGSSCVCSSSAAQVTQSHSARPAPHTSRTTTEAA